MIKKILVIAALTSLSCSNKKDGNILEHINQINSADALLNVHKFKEQNYYSDKKEVDFAKAVAVSNRATIDQLLKEGVDINTLGSDSISFLCWAFIKFQRNSFKYLLENGASPDLKLKGGNTIITFAKMQNEKFYSDMIVKYKTDSVNIE